MSKALPQARQTLVCGNLRILSCVLFGNFALETGDPRVVLLPLHLRPPFSGAVPLALLRPAKFGEGGRVAHE